MRNLAKMLIAGTTLLTLTAPVYAADTSVLNGQVNLADVFANNNLDIAHIGKTVTATATAVGNTVEIVTMQDSHVLNNQVATGNIAAALNVKASDIHGDVTFTSTALCNGASVSTDPTVTDVRSSQTCGVAPTPVMPPACACATTARSATRRATAPRC